MRAGECACPGTEGEREEGNLTAHVGQGRQGAAGEAGWPRKIIIKEEEGGRGNGT